jgi:hypothetical protein
MPIMPPSRSHTLLLLATLVAAGVAPEAVKPPTAAVSLVATPDGGIQPQAVIDSRGTLHLIYFKGQAGSGDLFYVRRPAGAAAFSAPLRVNSETGTAIATGTVRGGQLALGRNGRVHVAWNAAKPIGGAGNGAKHTPMWYARLSPGATAFEPQRAIGEHTRHLDGGGSIAADTRGRVYVVWHAAGLKDGEIDRRIYVARSTDDGKRFKSEEAFAPDGGLCGCCQLETLAESDGRLHILYRAAGGGVHRDAMWMTVGPTAASAAVRLQSWELPACPMTTFALAPGPGGIQAAWETQHQIHTATLDPTRGTFSSVAPIDGSAVRKHPSIAINKAGERLVAWTEGTAWARGGTLAWELQDKNGARLAGAVNAAPVPIWGLVSAIARPDGSFVIFH